MSRRFSMTSIDNPIPAVRASESQDEAKPLLADAEEKCDVVVEAIGFGNWSLLLVMGSSTTWVHTTELYSTDIRSTAHTLAFIVGRFGGFASGYVVENANSIPFATTVLIIMAALSALGTLTLRETMGERLS